MIQNPIIVLRQLLNGGIVQLNDQDFALDNDNNLASRYTEEYKGKMKDIWLKYDGSLTWFINECNKLSKDTIFLISANNALTNMRKTNGNEIE